MEELAQRLQQLETQVGQQRAVIEHQQEQVMRLCGNGHCDPDGVVGRTVCESHWSDDRSRQKETGDNAASLRPMEYELKHHEKVSRSGLCVEPYCE